MKSHTITCQDKSYLNAGIKRQGDKDKNSHIKAQ